MVPIGSGKQRAVLAALLLHANHVVMIDELAELVWPDPPPSARATLQNYVKRLRQALNASAWPLLLTRPSGYLISVEADELDLISFGQLCANGHSSAAAGNWELASAHLTAALSLWRGQPFADVPAEAFAIGEGLRLNEMRWQALEARLDADLRLGRHSRVAAEARQLVFAEPLRERLYGSLMLALYRCNQRAGALAAYRQARQILIGEVGIEPGPALRHLNQDILKASPDLDLPG